MNVYPEGEDLRNAVRWISEERTANPDADLVKLVSEACKRFDLPPNDCEFLSRKMLEK